MPRDKKFKDIRKNRLNFLPAVLISLVLVFIWLVYFFTVPPYGDFSSYMFLSLTFLVVFMVGSLVLGEKRRGFVLSSGVIIFLVLGYYGMGNWLNLLLIIGALISVEYYMYTRQ